MEKEIRKLKADEIECRVGTVKGDGFSLLLYKNARVDMAILDEVFGRYGWQREHKELKGNLYCGVGVYSKDLDEWVWKWDCGSESYTEKEKGESSDAFKRACVNIGIGRELYTSPFIWINGYNKTDRFYVSKITYNDKGEIQDLEIKHEKSGKVAYPKKKEAHNEAPVEDFTLEEYVGAIQKLKATIDKNDPAWWKGISTMFDVYAWDDITIEKAKEIGKLCKDKVQSIGKEK